MREFTVDKRELIVGYAFHQVAIVAYHDQRARPGIEQIFHGHSHIGVKIIAGLVQDKHVRRIKQNQHQLQTALLATGKRFDRHIQMSIGESQLLKQLSRGNFLAIYHVTSVVSRKNLANAIALQLFQFFELLGKESEFHGFSNFHAARLRAELALNDIEQRRFASTVRTQKAIAITRTDHPGNIIKNLVLPV